MTASHQIFLVMERGQPVTAFTGKRELQAYLRRGLDTFIHPLVYRLGGDGHLPVIMNMSRATADGERTSPLLQYIPFGKLPRLQIVSVTETPVDLMMPPE